MMGRLLLHLLPVLHVVLVSAFTPTTKIVHFSSTPQLSFPFLTTELKVSALENPNTNKKNDDEQKNSKTSKLDISKEEAYKLREQAKLMRFEAENQRRQLALEKMSKYEDALSRTMGANNTAFYSRSGNVNKIETKRHEIRLESSKNERKEGKSIPILDQFVNVLDKDTDVNSIIESNLPLTRKYRQGLTIDNLNVLLYQVLGKEVFLTSEKPQAIEGGYILRGHLSPDIKRKAETKEDQGLELISSIDEKLNKVAPGWTDNFQVCYIDDPAPRTLDGNSNDYANRGDPVLLVMSTDMKPSSKRIILSALSFYLIVQFATQTYGVTDAVVQHLHAAADKSWFYDLLYPLLIPLGVSQACHEAGHLLMAHKGGFKTNPPLIIPFLPLPYMSFQTKLNTSPKDFNSLFDFAFIGPMAGLLVSACFFMAGLHMTVNMDASALEYFPALPLGFIKLSKLGGTIINYVLGGGSEIGSILMQDPSTPITLHPYVIGGMTAFLINCLDLIPIGSTDGGRMSQSLLGRKEHVGVTAFVYGGLLLYGLFGGHTNFFLSFVFLSGLLQKDMEIPCRNELDKADLPRAVAALAVWCVAILALTPIG